MKVNSKKIRFEIERLGWTQTELANRANMTKQALSIILTRETAQLETLNKIGKALNLDPRDLLI